MRAGISVSVKSWQLKGRCTNMACTRRDAIIRMGTGAAGLALGRTAWAIPSITVDAVADLAKQFRTTPEAQVFEVCTKAIQSGADHKTLLTAVFVAGVLEIRPRPVGSKLHAVMMVESAFQLAETGSKRDAFRSALWSLHDFKRYQQRDVDEGDWVMPKSPGLSRQTNGTARRELLAAMDAWDAERADRALVGLLRRTSPNEVIELLRPYMARSFVDFGHKIIFGVQVERVLRRVNWRHAEPALRSLVNGLAYPGSDAPDTESFDRAMELALSFPAGWDSGHEDARQSESVLKRLRTCDCGEAQRLVVTALQEGIGPRTIWDGLRLYASELFLRRPPSSTRRHLPVHPVTEVNAFAYAYRSTTNDTTRRLLILQAAGWLPLWRPALANRFGAFADRSGIDALGQAEPVESPDIDATFAQRSPDAARVFLDNSTAQQEKYLAQLRAFLLQKAWQDHQFKYLAAIHEESKLADSRWRSRILAPAITYLPTAVDHDTEVSKRAERALRKAGVFSKF